MYDNIIYKRRARLELRHSTCGKTKAKNGREGGEERARVVQRDVVDPEKVRLSSIARIENPLT